MARDDSKPSDRPSDVPSRDRSSPVAEGKAGNVIERDSLSRVPRTTEERHARIAQTAYQIAQRRGFEAGHELDDWLEAERQIDG